MGFRDVLDRAFNIAGQGLGVAARGLGDLAGQGGWEEFSSNLPKLAGGGGGSNLPSLVGGGWGGSNLPALAGGGQGQSGLPTLAGGGDSFGRGAAGVAAGQAAYDLHHPRASTLPTATTPVTGLGGSASGGPYGNHEQYRASIVRYAQANGIDPDALAAILQIESPSGDPHAQSGAGAMGLGQFIPATWAAYGSGDPYNADDSIKAAAAYFGHLYKTFGDYSVAAAAYQSGEGNIVNGKPRSDISDGNLTPEQYAQRFAANYQGIKNAAPTAGVGNLTAFFAPGTAAPVMQPFGRTQYSTGEGAGVYDFGAQFGLDGDTHSGVDIGVPRGTQFVMPAGLTGTVTIAGGSGYYKTNSGDGPGKGELRIKLSNGWELILGHADQINVQVGQQVTAGQLLGLTGSSDGDHLHIEVRRPDPSTPSGWRIIDPSTLFGGMARS